MNKLILLTTRFLFSLRFPNPNIQPLCKFNNNTVSSDAFLNSKDSFVLTKYSKPSANSGNLFSSSWIFYSECAIFFLMFSSLLQHSGKTSLPLTLYVKTPSLQDFFFFFLNSLVDFVRVLGRSLFWGFHETRHQKWDLVVFLCSEKAF